MIDDTLWPMVLEAVKQGLALSIPTPDASALGLTRLAPALARFQLELTTRRPTTIRNDFLVLDLALTGKLP
jgi:hypothetical protein